MARTRRAGIASVVGAHEEGTRLDRWFRRYHPTVSYAHLHKIIRTGQVRVDGARCRPGQRLIQGQTVRVPPLVEEMKVKKSFAGSLKKFVLYRDKSFIVLNKPAGLAVQGGARVIRSLDSMLESLGCGEPPRLVHRLDKETSGVLVLARTLPVARYMANAFKNKKVRKLYWALTHGLPEPPKGEIKMPVRGRGDSGGMHTAHSRYTVVAHAEGISWVSLVLFTGRRHQVRLHTASLGTPIVGDSRYGGGAPPLCLHARRLDVENLDGGFLSVKAPLPEHMEGYWRDFGWDFLDGESDIRPDGREGC